MKSYKIQQIENPIQLGYVPSLDGLRAIAVCLVMCLHAHFQLGKNGGWGVTLFFALSGFLITTLLLEEFTKRKTVSLAAFYVRRTFRLFPLLYFLLLFILLYAVFFAEPSNSRIIKQEIIPSAFYINNISWLWNSPSLILGHTWSLAVEEQFYLVWPVILITAIKFYTIRSIRFFVLVFIVVSIFIKLLFPLSFYISFFNESLFAGCYFALYRFEKAKELNVSEFITITLIISFIIAGMFPVSFQAGIFQPVFDLFIGAVTVLIIAGLLKNRSGISSSILSFKPFEFTGKISYGLYLWHLPMFRIFAWHSPLPPAMSFCLKFLFTFLLATASYYLFEQKAILTGRSLSKKIIG
jgi:peptidoglycan/LPS O-acetylase OafA/YrhL